MGRRSATVVASVGAVAAGLGVIVATLFFLQPWRSCPYEDTAAGCAMLPRDAAVMMTAFFLAVLGAGVMVIGLMLRPRT